MIYYQPKVTPFPIFCDMIALTLSMPFQHREEVHSRVSELAQYYGSFAPRGKFYQFATNLNNSSDDPHVPYEHKLMVQWHLKDGGDPYLRFKWNPAKMGIAEVKYFINQILDGGYNELVERGKITEIHFSTDLVGATLDRMLISYPKMKREASNRISGRTEYLGCRAGSTFIRLYDKAAEVKVFNEKNPGYKKPLPEHPTIRLEIVKRSKSGANIWLRDLYAIQNPFQKFEIWPVPVSKYDEQNSLFWMSLAVWQDRGKASMMARLKMSPDAKKQYSKQFKKNAPPWWQPEQFWMEYVHSDELIGLTTG